jgi:hypothetical protein
VKVCATDARKFTNPRAEAVWKVERHALWLACSGLRYGRTKERVPQAEDAIADLRPAVRCCLADLKVCATDARKFAIDERI